MDVCDLGIWEFCWGKMQANHAIIQGLYGHWPGRWGIPFLLPHTMALPVDASVEFEHAIPQNMLIGTPRQAEQKACMEFGIMQDSHYSDAFLLPTMVVWFSGGLGARGNFSFEALGAFYRTVLVLTGKRETDLIRFKRCLDFDPSGLQEYVLVFQTVFCEKGEFWAFCLPFRQNTILFSGSSQLLGFLFKLLPYNISAPQGKFPEPQN